MSRCYEVPTELINPHLRPMAKADLVTLMMRGARPEPIVIVRELNGAWVARYAFKEAIKTADGPVDSFESRLSVHPEGGL